MKTKQTLKRIYRKPEFTRFGAVKELAACVSIVARDENTGADVMGANASRSNQNVQGMC